MSSNSFTLTAVSVAGIQNYIFGSNELKENVGASELVRQATEDKAFEVLGEFKPHNINDDGSPNPNRRIEQNRDLNAELFYAAGGSVLIIFRHEDHAKEFAYKLSRKLHVDIPGLPLYAAHVAFDWQTDSLAKAVDDVFTKMAYERGRIGPSTPLLGLSVTAACKSTGLPANVHHSDAKADDFNIAIKPVVSNEVAAKIECGSSATKSDSGFPTAEKRIRSLFDLGESVSWTNELNSIGRDSDKVREESYIAVVHIDGNGMGKRFLMLNQLFQALDSPARHNRQFIYAQRRFSNQVKDVYQSALTKTVSYLARNLETDSKKSKAFPFRPIVFGGDDITWVCRGELGLPLAHYFLMQLSLEELPGFDALVEEVYRDQAAPVLNVVAQCFGEFRANFTPYAAAGISIVKTHYPFSRAYDMSEQLLKSAKSRISALMPKDSDPALRAGFGIDWHFSTTGLQGSLDEIRNREFVCATLDRESLVGRPYVFGEELGETWRTWDNFQNALYGFQHGTWLGANNKLMALREALRSGPLAVKQFRSARRDADLPAIDIANNASDMSNPQRIEDGFLADGEDVKRSVYFDAIEVIDQYMDLSEAKK